MTLSWVVHRRASALGIISIPPRNHGNPHSLWYIFHCVLGSSVILESIHLYLFLLFIIPFLFGPEDFSFSLFAPLHHLGLHISRSSPFPTGQGLWFYYQLIICSSLKETAIFRHFHIFSISYWVVLSDHMVSPPLEPSSGWAIPLACTLIGSGVGM